MTKLKKIECITADWKDMQGACDDFRKLLAKIGYHSVDFGVGGDTYCFAIKEGKWLLSDIRKGTVDGEWMCQLEDYLDDGMDEADYNEDMESFIREVKDTQI